MSPTASTTMIGPSVHLILLDCFETLVELEGDRYHARRGAAAFLAHFAQRMRIPCAVVSDAKETAVRDALTQAGLLAPIAALYHADNALEIFPDGRALKRLNVPLQEFKVEAAQAVFIGDSKFDEAAARLYHVPFIRVPRSEDRAFSLERLITGPSRYQSAEFDLVVLQRYGIKPS